MEWLLLAAFVLAVALFVALPGAPAAADDALEDLEREHATLLAELRELDDDAAAGRISGDDRLAGRRALAPRLRAVTEALRAQGIEPRPATGPRAERPERTEAPAEPVR